ncbi:hypothetical protein [Ilumatobacter sp.]|uniref:hypothetical protein n=1 Tax=Ilumatobacter sp. TaxID=1967498 RepID=UPI003AF877B8
MTAPGGYEAMTEFFLGLQVWGTPAQVYDRIVGIQDNTYADAYMAVCSYAGMPDDEAERNLHLFAREVLPELKKLPHPYERLGTPDEAPAEDALAGVSASSWVPSSDG